MNAEIERIVDECIPEAWPGSRTAMKRAILARDNEVLDRLRLMAAQQGLLPGITAYLLTGVGLGETPDPEELERLRRQAEQERAAVLAQLGFPLPPLDQGD